MTTTRTDPSRPAPSSPTAGAPLAGIAGINRRIADGCATALTIAEICQASQGVTDPLKVDLITLAFPTAISGSAAMMVVPVAARGVFTRAEKIFVNHVRGHPGPAPNERLGVVDTLIFADESGAATEPRYDGSALFLDLIGGRRVQVECHSVEETVHRNVFDLAGLEFARFYVYNARLPEGSDELAIVRRSLVPGTRIVLNGSQGIVVGSGTRNRPGVMCLSLAADMHDMDATLMENPTGRPRHMVACALPVRDESDLGALREWGLSRAAEPLFCTAASKAAAELKQMIQENRFHLSETGPLDGKAMEG